MSTPKSFPQAFMSQAQPNWQMDPQEMVVLSNELMPASAKTPLPKAPFKALMEELNLFDFFNQK